MMEDFAVYESRSILLLVARLGSGFNLKSGVLALRIKRPSTREEVTCLNVDIKPVADIESEVSLSAYVERESLYLLHRDIMAVFGLIRFCNHFQLILVSKADEACRISDKSVFCVRKTISVPLTYRARSTIEETGSQNTFEQLDINDNFYFSNDYKLTNTWQHQCLYADADLSLQEKFVWNWHLLQPLLSALKQHSHSSIHQFITPFIYGYVKQYTISLTDERELLYTLISRRSVGFAGVRHLRRGVNSKGEVGNEIETEQIITLKDKAKYIEGDSSSISNAYVQVRGSIPLCWHHINYFAPQPGITLESDIDPTLVYSKLHYDSLVERYGRCIHVVSLLRQTAGREFQLHNAHRTACEELQLAHSNRILNFFEFDLLKYANHSAQQPDDTIENHHHHHQDGLQPLLEVLESMVLETGICTLSHPSSSDHTSMSEEDKEDNPHIQHGVIRTNCIDCLDRTNLVQFLAAQFAVTLQLNAIDVSLSSKEQSAFEKSMLEVWMEHGDRVALQYAGSAAMHRLERRSQQPGSTGGSKDSHNSSSTNALLDLRLPGNDSQGCGFDSVDSEAAGGAVSPATKASHDNLTVVSNLASNAFIALQRYCGNVSIDFDRQRAIDMMLGWHDASVECYPEYHRVVPVRPKDYITVKVMNDFIANCDSHTVS